MPTTRTRAGKSFDDVLKRAAGAGYKKPFVEKIVLPDWWEDEIAQTPAGREAGIGYLALRLGLSAPSLREGEHAERIQQAGVKYKMRENVAEADLDPAKAVASWALRMALCAMPETPREALSAEAHRTRILAGGAPWVDFEHVLDACWDLGIPVLPIANPGGRKKMDGLAARFTGRFGIALCGAFSSPSKQAFILAHELGHIASGHLASDGVIVDEGTTERAAEGSHDAEEDEANGYARALLLPHFESFLHPGQSGQSLAAWARRHAGHFQIDPAFLASNWGHTQKQSGKPKWNVVGAALRELEAGRDALAMMQHAVEDRLEWGCLSEEEADYLRRLTGLDTPA